MCGGAKKQNKDRVVMVRERREGKTKRERRIKRKSRGDAQMYGQTERYRAVETNTLRR